MPQILVAGSFNQDITAYADSLPDQGETKFASDVQISPGGKGFNQAFAAHRILQDKQKIAFAGHVGSDDAAKYLFSLMAKEGMETQYINQYPRQKTGKAFIWVNNHNGNNQILVHSGANAYFDKDTHFLKHHHQSLQNTQYVLLQHETCDDFNAAFIEASKEHQYRVILNPAPAKKLAPQLLQHIWAITPNEHEAAIICNHPCETVDDYQHCAHWLFDQGVKLVLITLGSKGIYYNDGNISGIIEGRKVNAINTVGAGDCFNGCFAAAMLESEDLIYAIKFANHAASISVQRHGAAESMPYKDEVLKIMP